MGRFAAVDLGASSGRVLVGSVGSGTVDLTEVHRFPNRPVRVGGRLHWDVLALWAGVVDGVRAAAADGPLDGIGIDSWAVDYALLDTDGRLLGNPVHYRDARTDGVAAHVDTVIDPAELYRRTGVQRLPFNTVYQWVSARDDAAMRQARTALMIPDLFAYWLTGELGTELTNASTTALLDVDTGEWADDLLERLGLRADLLPPIRRPGDRIGTVRAELADELGFSGVPVYAVGSHDTASAVAGVPSDRPDFAYISCGTWSLVGVELPAPVTTDAARAANFSNELGVDGTVRFLRNVMGLWLLQECIRTWERTGPPVDLPALLEQTAALPTTGVIDPDRPEFLPPGDMPARLAAQCRADGLPVPATPAEFTRLILDSLAEAYRRAVAQAAELSGREVSVVHLVGGGAQNALLARLTAQACGLPVVAGPVESAGYGNVLVQARAAGAVHGTLADLRRLVPRDSMKTFASTAAGPEPPR